MTMTNVCIVDDSESFSRWLEADLSVFNEVSVTCTADTVEKAKNLIEHELPDIVILDLRLIGGTGFDILEYVRDLEKKPVIYILTSYSPEIVKNKCLELGAEGFYDKSSDYFKLIDAVRFFNKTKQ